MPSSVITYYDIELVVEYSVTGKHLPATALDPEEFPDVSITAIRVGNVNILPIVGELYQDEIHDIIFEIILDNEIR